MSDALGRFVGAATASSSRARSRVVAVPLHPVEADGVLVPQFRRARQSSAFLTGCFDLVFQPFFFQPLIQDSRPSSTYLLSE